MLLHIVVLTKTILSIYKIICHAIHVILEKVIIFYFILCYNKFLQKIFT